MIRLRTAILNWSLYVDCPNCKSRNDLSDAHHDVEYHIARRIFTNEWDKLAGWEVVCDSCGHEFLLDGVVY
jgi:hypothetical protein